MPEIDLLGIERGTVVAPAGCGKTHLIAETLAGRRDGKPTLILTHTNAGVAALRGRLDRMGVPPRAYRLVTIDGWAIRLIRTFPVRSGHDPAILDLTRRGRDYHAIRDAAWKLLKAKHVDEILASSYEGLIVDEVQDCSIRQFALVFYAANTLHTRLLGDHMQAIFDFDRDDRVVNWTDEVQKYFPQSGELTTPWRWINAGTENFGRWLLEARRKLVAGDPIDLRAAPAEVTWVRLDGSAEDEKRRLAAASIEPPNADGKVLVIDDSTKPARHQFVASQIPGAVTVESVDLRGLVDFARALDFEATNALSQVVNFASTIMTNVGVNDLLQRVRLLENNAGRREVSNVEEAALAFRALPCGSTTVELLVQIGQQGGVRNYRPAVFRACIRALQTCDGTDGNTFYDAAIRAREQNRLVGRLLPKRAVGSTLLLKGLEADVSVVLNAADLNARNLYVAMTRGARALVICSPSPTLNPAPMN